MNLSAVRLTNGGALAAGLAELEDIPWPDTEPVYSILVQPVGEASVGEAEA